MLRLDLARPRGHRVAAESSTPTPSAHLLRTLAHPCHSLWVGDSAADELLRSVPRIMPSGAHLRSPTPSCAADVDRTLGGTGPWPDEECDSGEENADDQACTSTCKLAVCGDGLMGPGEGCDDGNDDDSDECTNACALASCGDGILGPGEECDDGNMSDDDACLQTCVAASCGDGFVYTDGGEECDDDGVDSETCDNDCSLAVCGDGYLNTLAMEECEDGNDVDDDACSNACVTATCDDGVKNDVETDVDCGGGTCGACETGQACESAEDCISQVCQDNVCSYTDIVIAALNEAHQGDLGGLAGADALCAAQAMDAMQDGTWVALLATQNENPNRDFTTLFPGAQGTNFPVKNIQGTELLPFWNQMFLNASGQIADDIYTFSGVEVEEGMANPDWNDADGWTGALTTGLVAANQTCTDWTSTAGTGRNTELDARQLLRQETKNCNIFHAVMCVRVLQ